MKKNFKKFVKLQSGSPSTTFRGPKSGAGFTLIEIVIFLGLAVGILLVVSGFIRNITSFGTYFGETFKAEQEIQQTLEVITSEIRSIAQSNVGNYPIGAASDTSLTFYSDINQDGLFDRVRYYLDNGTFRKGVIVPTGNPLSYDPGNEVINDVVQNISTTTIFQYYDTNYTGSSSPLALPINISDIRVIKVILSVDSNPLVPPGPVTFSSQITPRNLRDNSL